MANKSFRVEKATRSRSGDECNQGAQKEPCLESPVSVNRQQEMAAAAMEALQQQTAAIDLHIEGAVDAVEKSLSLLILRWRSKRLTEAWVSYEQALATLLAKVADVELRDQAKAQWRLLRDNSNEVWDQIEMLIEAKAEEKASAIWVEQELCATEVEVEVESCAAKAEVEVEMLAKDQVEELCAAKDKLEFFAIKYELEERRIAEVVVEECANKEVLSSSGQLDPGERDQQVTAKDKLGQESGAKQDLIEIGAKQDPVEEFRATKVELEFRVAKDAEFELLRFVTAGCRAQNAHSEYG